MRLNLLDVASVFSEGRRDQTGKAGFLGRKSTVQVPKNSFAVIWERGRAGLRTCWAQDDLLPIVLSARDRYMLIAREVPVRVDVSDVCFKDDVKGQLEVELSLRWLAEFFPGSDFKPGSPDRMASELLAALESLLIEQWTSKLDVSFQSGLEKELGRILGDGLSSAELRRKVGPKLGFIVQNVKVLSATAPEYEAFQDSLKDISIESAKQQAETAAQAVKKTGELKLKEIDSAIDSYELEKKLQQERVKQEKIKTDRIKKESDLAIRKLEKQLESLQVKQQEKMEDLKAPVGLQAALKEYDRSGNLLCSNVENGASVCSGAFIRLEVEVDCEAWVYVLLHNAEREWQRLVPDTIFGGFSQNHLQPGGKKVLWPPSGELAHPYWELNDKAGVENLIVVASKEPLALGASVKEEKTRGLIESGAPAFMRGVIKPTDPVETSISGGYAEVFDQLVGDGLVVKELSFRHV